MRNPKQYPKLRWPLDVHFEKINGQTVLLLRCPLGLAAQPLALVPAAAGVLQALDGLTSTADLLKRFTPLGLTEQTLREFLNLLEGHLFLDGPAFEAARTTLLADYAGSKTRAAALAGRGYPAASKELRALVTGYLEDAAPADAEQRELIGLIVPHIDYQRGGKSYGAAYRKLAGQPCDLFLIFGIAHQYSRHLFHLTRKDFETPLGAVPCESSLVNRLAELYGPERSFADEILHKEEHSIELQLPFLLQVQPQAKIVPILVGSLHELLQQRQAPQGYEAYDSFLAALVSVLTPLLQAGRRICTIAAVDMAHVGRYFGDPEGLSPERLEQVRQRDAEYLAAVSSHDLTALFTHLAADQDARHICGFPAVYTMLDLLKRLGISYHADIVAYEQAVTYEIDRAVSFTGAGLYKR